MLASLFTILCAGIFMGAGIMLLTALAWFLWTFLTPEDRQNPPRACRFAPVVVENNKLRPFESVPCPATNRVSTKEQFQAAFLLPMMTALVALAMGLNGLLPRKHRIPETPTAM